MIASLLNDLVSELRPIMPEDLELIIDVDAEIPAVMNGDAIKMVKRNGKTYVEITDYVQLRTLIARLLAEVQRIKSEGDFEAARQLVETYAVKVDATLHQEVLERYCKLNLTPYKGFINPMLLPVLDEKGDICDIQINYSESYAHQMLRYSSEYGTLI